MTPSESRPRFPAGGLRHGSGESRQGSCSVQGPGCSPSGGREHRRPWAGWWGRRGGLPRCFGLLGQAPEPREARSTAGRRGPMPLAADASRPPDRRSVLLNRGHWPGRWRGRLPSSRGKGWRVRPARPCRLLPGTARPAFDRIGVPAPAASAAGMPPPRARGCCGTTDGIPIDAGRAPPPSRHGWLQ